MLRGLVSDIRDFIFPDVSIFSEEKIHIENSNRYILNSEFENLEKVITEDLAKLKSRVNADYVLSFYEFKADNEVQKLIHSIKYAGMKNLGFYFGNYVGKSVKEYLDNNKIKIDFIIPVPLHNAKMRERGFNQSDYISSGISAATGIPIEKNTVIRVKNTRSQTKLKLEARLKNVKNAFTFEKNKQNFLRSKNIMLVDDIITTGSTVNEIISLLKKHNTGEITVCSLAIAED
ncbi:MAG TPA: ComF family protein [Ignavibacteria bacterium]|nr:ComF family protein [Ignavibacteria bacterium]